MIHPMLIRAAIIGILTGMLPSSPATARTIWPHGAKAAIILTYDDALDSQLDHAIPVLDAARFKATFFLSNVQQRDVGRWRAVAAEGHELANHTIFHPCAAGKIATDPRYTSDAYTPSDMLKEIAQQDVLLTAIDGRPRHGYATPCGETRVGGIDYLEDLRRSGLVTYARGVVTTPDDLRADVASVDPMHIPARGFPEGTTGAQLIDFARQAMDGGGWAVFLFHGVGGDYLDVSEEAHRQLLGWLKVNHRRLWVTTLQSALDWARQHPARPSS